MLTLTKKSPCRQKGIVLLSLVILFVLAVMAYFLSGLSVVEIKQHQVESTAKSLHQAKQALIAYAVSYADIDGPDADALPDFPGEYGFLPCPDYNGADIEGQEDSGDCGVSGRPKLGFLPWQTLGLPVLKDVGGGCLLYAVTGEYKNDGDTPSNKTQMLNEDSNGMFQIVDDAGAVVRGVNPQDRIVAIIIAPGEAVQGQARNFTLGSFCGSDYANYSAYLEAGGGTDNSDVSLVPGVLDQFIHATAASTANNNPNPYNDKFLTITRDEIWSAVVGRTDVVQKMTDLTEALAMCLSNYATANTIDRLPWPAAMTLADYRVSGNYDDNVGLGYAGRFPLFTGDSNGAIPGANVSAELFIEAACNALVVTSGATVDLQTPDAEYRVLLENWKDHFFYVVSQDYAPDTVSSTCGTCITVGPGPAIGVQRAAMVIFGNTRQGVQSRNEPTAVDADTKFNIWNYMENGNEGNFPDPTGSANYLTSGSNDIMYCLTTASPPAVVQC